MSRSRINQQYFQCEFDFTKNKYPQSSNLRTKDRLEKASKLLTKVNQNTSLSHKTSFTETENYKTLFILTK